MQIGEGSAKEGNELFESFWTTILSAHTYNSTLIYTYYMEDWKNVERE
jgi:hypothetical protein